MVQKSRSSRDVVPTPTTKLDNPLSTAVRPSWPPMNAGISAEDLSYNILLSEQILTISNLWSNSLCKRYVNFLSSLPLSTTPGKPKKGEAVRFNDRFQIDDRVFAHQLWSESALRNMVEEPNINGNILDKKQREELWGGEVLGLNSNIRIYRYSKGQFFAQHYDDFNNITFEAQSGEKIAAKTTWTMLLYLSAPSTGCVGGETVFYPEAKHKREATPAPIIANLEVGTVLLHKHGADCLLHEGRPVTAGEKWVIRSDLCVRR